MLTSDRLHSELIGRHTRVIRNGDYLLWFPWLDACRRRTYAWEGAEWRQLGIGTITRNSKNKKNFHLLRLSTLVVITSVVFRSLNFKKNNSGSG